MPANPTTSKPAKISRRLKPKSTAPKLPQLKWDKTKRLVICCLFRFFVCDRAQTEQLFAYIFQNHLNERGIPGVAPFRRLRTQWTWMALNKHSVWELARHPAFESSDEAKEITRKITSAAAALGTQLQRRILDEPHTPAQWPATDQVSAV